MQQTHDADGAIKSSKTILPAQFIPGKIYFFLFTLLGIVYVIGLFVPLMDNDAAHHANIGLHMYLTGDYVHLIDVNKDYLDKPHLLFWLAAASYHLFGVSAFAYKFPSFLFSILGIYSTYRIGKALYDAEVGKLAALMCSCAFAFILQNSDVRMDAILTASAAFAVWQLVELILHRKFINVAGAALGLALGFAVKGLIGVFAPAVAIFFYVMYRNSWSIIFNWRWAVMIVLFMVLSSPVIYCYYVQYDSYSETVIREQVHISGVQFILWGQTIERYDGSAYGGTGRTDYPFFLHTFLWAFAPWSLLMYLTFMFRIKNFFTQKEEWLTTGFFCVLLAMFSFAGYKLPHYLNVMFPLCAVATASFILNNAANEKWVRAITTIQFIASIVILILALAVNVWAFPINKTWVAFVAIVLVGVVIWSFINKRFTQLQKAVLLSVSTMIFLFFLLNTNFYPQLLTYQSGNELAEKIKGKINPRDVYFYDGVLNHSFTFYTASIRQPFSDAVLQQKKNLWVFTDTDGLNDLYNKHYNITNKISQRDYRVSQLTFKFVNPSTREPACNYVWLVNISLR